MEKPVLLLVLIAMVATPALARHSNPFHSSKGFRHSHGHLSSHKGHTLSTRNHHPGYTRSYTRKDGTFVSGHLHQ